MEDFVDDVDDENEEAGPRAYIHHLQWQKPCRRLRQMSKIGLRVRMLS